MGGPEASIRTPRRPSRRRWTPRPPRAPAPADACCICTAAAGPASDDDAFDAGADKYLLAKTYFDCREYRRAAHVLRGHVGRKAVFLRCYALYMVRCTCPVIQ
jgi:anaphase-promoting complex subunit 8